jgi:hypothetical protein
LSKNSKSQQPSSKEYSITNHQWDARESLLNVGARSFFGDWSLGFGASMSTALTKVIMVVIR